MTITNEDNMEGIKISKNWDCVISFEELVKKSKFCFRHNSFAGSIVMVVLKEPISPIGIVRTDCLGISYDRYGILVNSETTFNESWGNKITDSSKDVVGFIKKFIIKDGASDLLTPKNK